MRGVLDACVLYPTVLREVLLAVAGAGQFEVLWSDRILEEWRRRALRDGPADAALVEGEIARLGAKWPAAQVSGYERREAELYLPDPADIHVLAAAIEAEADVIVTLNLRDFPSRELGAHGVVARHPDAFLYDLWKRSPADVETAVRSVHAEAERLSGEQINLRALLKRARLPRLGKALG